MFKFGLSEIIVLGKPWDSVRPMVCNDPWGGWLGRPLTAAEGEAGASLLPGQAGKWTRCSSAEHRAKIIHPLLHAELKITNHVIRGGGWCGQTEWMLKARKVMPKFLMTWAYHVQWLLLAHEIEPFSLLSAFPPQLGPQVAFSLVWKEDSYCHLSRELIKRKNTRPFSRG